MLHFHDGSNTLGGCLLQFQRRTSARKEPPTMTPTRQRRISRPLKAAAIGTLALTAAVALPAFALDRGADTEPVAISTAVAEQEAAARAATERYRFAATAYEAERQRLETEAILAAIAALPPEEQFTLRFNAMSEAERVQTFEFFAGLEAAAEAERAAQRAAQRAADEAARAERASRPSAVTTSGGNGVWDTIARCESSGNWSMNSGNGYSGGLQFHPGTWRSAGGTAYAPFAYQATPAQQIEIAERVLASQGWGAWPACSRRAGLR